MSVITISAETKSMIKLTAPVSHCLVGKLKLIQTVKQGDLITLIFVPVIHLHASLIQYTCSPWWQWLSESCHSLCRGNAYYICILK